MTELATVPARVSNESLVKSESAQLATSMVSAQAEAQIKARYLYAERHPRDLDLVRQKLLKECRRPAFAAVARYLKPRGKGVEGPSIRFAEAAIRLMGNIAVEQSTIYDDREKRIVRVTGVHHCCDAGRVGGGVIARIF